MRKKLDKVLEANQNLAKQLSQDKFSQRGDKQTSRELSDKLGEIDSQMAIFKDRITEVKMIGRKESEKLRGELKFNLILHLKRLDKIKMMTIQAMSDLDIKNY